MRRQFTANVDSKRITVIDKLVLPTDHINIGKRQIAFYGSRNRCQHAAFQLVAVKRRSVDRNNQISTGFFKTFNNILFPDIFTNWKTYLQSTKHNRSWQIPRGKITLVIKNTIIWQIHLVAASDLLTSFKHENRIIDFSIFGIGRTYNNCWPAIGGKCGQVINTSDDAHHKIWP